MAALFGNGSQGSSSLSVRPLVEFRAGKMNIEGNLVTADKRKGLVYITQGEDDSLMHFVWKDRTTGAIGDDLIIFPDDIEYKKVQCAGPNARVFVLKFKASSKKMFFWMQEPKDDKDEEYVKKVNDLLNNPPSASSVASSRSSALGGMDLNNLRDSEMQSLLNNMSQQQLMQLFGSGSGLGSLLNSVSGPSRRRFPTRSTTSTPSRSNSDAPTVEPPTNDDDSNKQQNEANPIQLSDLKSILSGIQVPPTDVEPSVDLSTTINTEVLMPLLENKEFVAKMQTLLPKEGDQSSIEPTQEIKGTVQSPQFQQALRMFSMALQSGQLAPLIREFDLGDEAIAAATAGSMELFIKALQKAKSSLPEDMALD